MSNADELEKLHKLHTQGVITSEEFATQKAMLMGQAGPTATASPPPQDERKRSMLAVLAFVLSFIASPVGLLMGIVAVITVGTSKGKLRGIGFGIAAICVGLLLSVILAAVAIPALIYANEVQTASEFTAEVEAEEARLSQKAEADRRRAEAVAIEAQRRAEEAAQVAKKLVGTLAEKEAIETARRLAAEADEARKSAQMAGGGAASGGGKKGGKIDNDPLGGIDL